jgi:hypothetical protein
MGWGDRRRHGGFIPSSTIGKAPDVVPCRAHSPLRGRELDVTTHITQQLQSGRSHIRGVHVHVPFMGPESNPSGLARWPPYPFSYSTIAVFCPILAPPPTSAISLTNHPPCSIVHRPSMHKARAPASYLLLSFHGAGSWLEDRNCVYAYVLLITPKSPAATTERTQAEQGEGR